MKTSHIKAVDVEQRWLLYDASEHTLGRMAAEIAMALMGKDRPTYTPSELCGAHVVVVNSGQARLTGRKGDQKRYDHYTRYHGGLREVPYDRVRERRPNDIVILAVRRMLPKNKLGHDMLRRLKVYEGPEHPHAAQRPVKVERSQ
jgi:large subunit ribosomal protein L13